MSNELDPRENGTPFYTAPLGKTDAEEQAEANGQVGSNIDAPTEYNMDEFLQNLRVRNEQQRRENEAEASRPRHVQKISQEPRQDIHTPINKWPTRT